MSGTASVQRQILDRPLNMQGIGWFVLLMLSAVPIYWLGIGGVGQV